MTRYICSHSGGNECTGCKCNKAHSVTGIDPQYKHACASEKHYCAYAMNDMSGAKVQCFPIDS